MIINIEKTIIRKKLYSLYKIVFLIISIIIVVVLDFYYEDFFGVSNSLIYIILASLYLLSVIFNLLRDYQYIYFSDEGDKIILRYFSPGIFTTKKNSIEINKSFFAGFKITKSFFGIKEKIVLSQKTKRGIANYPAVSITALSQEEKKRITDSLNKFK